MIARKLYHHSPAGRIAHAACRLAIGLTWGIARIPHHATSTSLRFNIDGTKGPPCWGVAWLWWKCWYWPGFVERGYGIDWPWSAEYGSLKESADA